MRDKTYYMNENQIISLSAYVLISKNRHAVFKILEKTNKTPRDLAKETKLRPNYISALLGELRNRELVECINPEAHKGRVYKLTDTGQNVSKFLKETENLSKI